MVQSWKLVYSPILTWSMPFVDLFPFIVSYAMFPYLKGYSTQSHLASKIGINSLNFRILVLAVSAPVVLVDEVLKVISRARNAKSLAERKKIQWAS